MNHAKAEALRALEHVVDRLKDHAPIDGLERAQLVATIEYAAEQVAAIQELQRKRRAPQERTVAAGTGLAPGLEAPPF